MLITRSPLRITLGGGGTDLASYYEKREGFLISAAIDRYVYILINRTFDQTILLKYSKLERVREAGELEHPIAREALHMLGLGKEPLEICSMADIPAGTGLGSSGAFTVSLLKALHSYKGDITGTRPGSCDVPFIAVERLEKRHRKRPRRAEACPGGDIRHGADLKGLFSQSQHMQRLPGNRVLQLAGLPHALQL